MKKLKVAFVVIILASLLVVPWTQAQNVTNVSLNVSNEQEAEVEDVFKDITAPNLVLSETKTGRILYERNADEKISRCAARSCDGLCHGLLRQQKGR